MAQAQYTQNCDDSVVVPKHAGTKEKSKSCVG